jgi:hypothetical protein
MGIFCIQPGMAGAAGALETLSAAWYDTDKQAENRQNAKKEQRFLKKYIKQEIVR